MLKRLAFSGLGFALLVTPLFASAQLTVSTTNDNQTQIQELTEMPIKILLFKHLRHIPPGEQGLEILRWCYLDALKADTHDFKRVRFWQNLKKTKV